MTVYLTGDTHGKFDRVVEFCERFELSHDDVVIILGDAGLNYYGNKTDRRCKGRLAALKPTFFCIHGNHEMRPQRIPTYREKIWRDGAVLFEEDYPNILFPVDGEIFTFEGSNAIVIGGAYSVDKYYRLMRGWRWFEDEQPSSAIKNAVEEALAKCGYKVDYVLTHTCPLMYEPTEVFLDGIDQSTVDKTTEEWLGELEEKMDYKRWYCGHFHTAKTIDRMRFMFEDWVTLGKDTPLMERGV